MPLRLRLVLLILLVALPIVLIQIVFELRSREARRERILERAQTVAVQIASRQDRFVEAARFLLTGISRLSEVRGRDPVGCSRELGEIATQFPEITGIGAFTPDGRSFCSSGGATQTVSIADRPYFQAMLRTRTLQTSGYIVGRRTGKGSFVFVHPVLNDDGTVHVVGLLALSTEMLSRDLSDPPLSAGAFVTLLDRNGVVVARWPEPDEWMGRDLSGVAWARAAMKERRGATRVSLDGAEEHALAYAPMQPPTDVTVVVGHPIAPEIRRTEMLFWQEIGLTISVFLLTAVGAWLGATLVVQRPIRALSDHVDALAKSEFDRPSALPAGGIPELRALASHFQRMAEALAVRQAELMEALRQKEMLLKEVNHRVKNSLQLVASLFGLQRSRITDPQVRRHFEDAMQRVSTVARVHQRLYQDQHVHSIRFDEFLSEMCSELNLALRGPDGPFLECHVSECRLPTDQAIPLALIVNELVTNAFKYAYLDRTPGVIRVNFLTHEKELMLAVSDDGIALPPGFDLATSDGLGMRVMVVLVKQLRGHIKIVSQPAGKAFVVHVPIFRSPNA